MSRRLDPWQCNLSQFILAMSLALTMGGFTGWGLADLSRGYRSENGQRALRDCTKAQAITDKRLADAVAQSNTDRENCDKPALECQRRWLECHGQLLAAEKDQAICYGLLKAGPPECMAAMLAYDLGVPKKKPAKKPKKGKP